MKKKLIMWMGSAYGGVFPKFDGPKGDAYHYFFKKASDRFDFYIAFGSEHYLGNDTFKDLAVYRGGKLVEAEDGEVQADVIYYYSNAMGDKELVTNARVINSQQFKRFGADKFTQYQYLEEFFPKTEKFVSAAEVEHFLSKFKEDEFVVLKPCRASCGDGVIVSRAKDISIDQLDTDKLQSHGYVGQEFMDTSNGIPSVTESTHDLRIMTMIDEIVLCHVRTPQAGSLVGNTHKGAGMTELFFNDLPTEVQDFYRRVHAKIKTEYPEPLYSMDLGLTPNGPLLFEINAHTAFPREDFSVFESFIEKLLNTLENN